jgi:hypothetical protein
MDDKHISKILLRYLITLILAINIKYLYIILSIPTIFLSSLFLYPFYNLEVYYLERIIVVDSSIFNLVEACIAGSAYVLLITLNLATPMNPGKRLKSLAFLILSFLALNSIRIPLFAALYIGGFRYFNFSHYLFWYLGSTVIVILLWFLSIRLFRIYNIPLYTDIKALVRELRKGN